MFESNCIIWVNLGNQFGDTNIHLIPIDDINLTSIRIDVMPQKEFDGFFCINDQPEGIRNFSILKDLIKSKNLDLIPINGVHPLLTDENKEFIKNKSIDYYNQLQMVSMLYVNQDFNQAEKNMNYWSEELRNFVNKSR